MGAYAWVFDVTCLVLILVVAYAVGSEGLYGAAIMFVNVMFAGLIAFSTYEPVARIFGGIGFMETFADFVSLIIVFGVTFSAIRFVTDYAGPWYVRFHGALDQVGRYAFGLATGWYLVGMMVCMVQTAPVHKKFLGYQWETHALWTMGIDRFWLGYVQASTERYFEWSPTRPFDPRSNFIMRYHKWRPFGDSDPSLAPSGASPAAGSGGGQPNAPGGGAPGGGAPGGGAPGGGAPGGAMGGRPPLDPTGATQKSGF